MRILVATDAWHPQVNGVVRTYERLAQEAEKQGFALHFLAPSAFRTLPCPTYPGNPAVACLAPRHRPPYRGGAAGLHPYRDGGSDRADGAELLPQDEAAFHHELSHALPGIYLGAAAGAGALGLCAAAAVSQWRGRHLRRHALA